MQDWTTCRGFANPPWCLIHRCLIYQSEKTSSTDSSDNTLVENPIMVSNSTGTSGGRIPQQQDLVSMRINATGIGLPDATRSTSIGRLAYLRQSYASRGISAEASDLMLRSWREKTNSNYASSFSRWASWCQQRGRDPLAGPIEDVVNFLAGLYSEGYQYQSLNDYHSANLIYSSVCGWCQRGQSSYGNTPPSGSFQL